MATRAVLNPQAETAMMISCAPRSTGGEDEGKLILAGQLPDKAGIERYLGGHRISGASSQTLRGDEPWDG